MDRGKYNCVDYGHGGGAIKKIRTVRKAGDEEENVGSSSRRAGESASTVTNNRIPPAPPPPMISKMRNPPPPPIISSQRDKEPLKRPHRDDNDRDRPGPSRCHKLPRLDSRDERGDKNHHHRRSNHNPEPSRNNNKEVFQVPLPDCPLPSTIDVMDSQSEASNSPNPDCLPSSPDDETDLYVVTDAIVRIPANLANRSSSNAQQPAPKSKSHLGPAGPFLASYKRPKQRPSLHYKNRNNSNSSNGNNKRSDGQSGQRRSCDSRKSSTDSEKSLEEARRRGEEHQRRRSNDEVRGGKNNEKSPPKSSQQSAPILITPGISSQKNNPPGNPSLKDCGSKEVDNLRKFLATSSNAKENLSQALLRVTAQAKAVAEKTSDLNKTTQQSETSSRPQSSQWIVIPPQASKGAAPTPSTNLSPAKGSITVAQKVSPAKSSPIPTELAPKVSSAPPQKISPAKSSPTLVEKVSPPKGSPTLAQKVSPAKSSLIPAEGGAAKVSPTAAEKPSPTAAEKASPTDAEKASPTAAEKASPTAPDKSSPAKSLAAPSVPPRPAEPPEAPKTRNLSSSSESDEIQPKISLVPLAAITRKIPPDTTKIPRGNPDTLASKTTNNQAGAVLTSKTKTGSQERKTLSDELFAREVESARAKLSSKEPAFASNDDLLNTLLGACDDDELNGAQMTAIVSISGQDASSCENAEPGKDYANSAGTEEIVEENAGVKTTEVIPGLDLVCNDQPSAAADALNALSSCLQNSSACSVEEDDVTTAPTAPAVDANEMSSKSSEGPDSSNQGPATRLESVETMAEKPCCEESIPELVDEGPEKIANISPAACAKLKVNLLLNTTEKNLALPIPSSVNHQSDNEADETEADMSTENLEVSTSIAPRGTDVTENSSASLQAQANPMILNVNIVSVSIPTEDSNAEGPVRCSEDEQDLTCETSGQDQTGNETQTEISKETPTESMSIPTDNQTGSVSVPKETPMEIASVSNENQTQIVPVPNENQTQIVSVSNENQSEIVSKPNATHTKIPNENQAAIVSNPNESHTEIPNEKEACNDCPSSSNGKSAPVYDKEQLGHVASSIEDENGEEFSGEEHSVVSINSVSTIEDNLAGQSRAEITQNESSTTTLEQSETDRDAQAKESDSVSNEEGPVATKNSAGIREDTTMALVEPIEMREVVREVGQLMTNLSDAPPLTEAIPPEPMEVEESSGTLEENTTTTKDSEATAAGESTPLLTPPASSEALPKVELNFRFRGEADDENVFLIDDDNEPQNGVENVVAISSNPNDETASTSQANNETAGVGSIENYPILQILQEHKSGTDVGIQVDLLSDPTLRIRTDLFDPTPSTVIDPDDQIPVSEQVNSAARKVKLDFFKNIALLCNKFSKVIEKAGGDSTDEVGKLEEVLARMRVLTDRQYCYLDHIEIILSDLRKKAAGSSGESSSDNLRITDPLESVDPIELITVEDLSLYFHSLLLIDSVPSRKISSLQELIYHQRYRICRLMFYFLRSNIALEEAYGMNICNLLYSKVKSGQEEISWTTENVVKCWDAVRLFSGELDVRAIQLDHKRIGASGFFKQAKTLVKKMKAENAAGSEGVGQLQPQQNLQQNQQQQQNLQQNQQQQQNLQQNQQQQQILQQNQQQQQNLQHNQQQQQNFQQQQIFQQTTVPMPQNTPPARGNLVGSHSPMSPSVAGGTLDVEVIHVQGAASPQDRCQVVQYQQQAQQLQQQRQQQMTLQQQQQQHVQQQQQQHVPQQQQQHVQQQNLQHHQVLRNQLLQRQELQRRGSTENIYQYPQNIQQQTQQNGLAQMLMSPGQQQQFSVRRQTPQMAQRQQQQLYPQYSQQQQQVQLRQQHQQVQLQQQQVQLQQQPVQLTQQHQVQLTQQQQLHLQQQQQVQLQQLQQVQLQQQQQQAQLQQQQVQYQQQQQIAPEQQILAQQLLLNQQQQQVLSQQQQQMGFTQQQQHQRQYPPAMHRATVGVIPRQPPAQTSQVAQSVHHQIRPQSSPTDQRGPTPQMIPDQRTCQSFSVQQQQHRPNSRGTPVLQSTPVPYQAISSPISPPVAPGQFNSRRRTPGVQQNFVAENNNNVSSLSTSSSAASTSAIRVDIGGNVGTTLYVAYSRSNAVQNLVQSTQQQQQQQSTPPVLQQSTPPILQQTAGVQQQRRSSSSGIGLVANNNVYEEQQEQENPSVLPSIDDDLIFPML